MSMNPIIIPDDIIKLAEEHIVETTTLEPKQIARAVHKGPYSTIGETIEKLFRWVVAEGYQPIGYPSSTYYNDPSNAAEDELITEVYIPIKKVNSDE